MCIVKFMNFDSYYVRLVIIIFSIVRIRVFISSRCNCNQRSSVFSRSSQFDYIFTFIIGKFYFLNIKSVYGLERVLLRLKKRKKKQKSREKKVNLKERYIFQYRIVISFYLTMKKFFKEGAFKIVKFIGKMSELEEDR